MHFKSEDNLIEFMNVVMGDPSQFMHYENRIFAGSVESPKGTAIPITLMTGGYQQWYAFHIGNSFLQQLAGVPGNELLIDSLHVADPELPELTQPVKDALVKALEHGFIPVVFMQTILSSANGRDGTPLEERQTFKALTALLDHLVDL